MKVKIILVLMSVICASAMFAQTSKNEMKEMIKARKAALNYTESQLKTKVLKDAKKQAKLMKKEGWLPAVGTLDIEKQLTDVYVKQFATDGNFPRYIIGKGIAQSSTLGMARKHAIARARVDIANQMSEEVAALTEMTESNVELSKQDVETVAKMLETSKLLSQKSLGKTEVISETYRNGQDKTEVQVIVCYESKEAIKSLLESFDNENSEIKEKLEKLLNKENK